MRMKAYRGCLFSTVGGEYLADAPICRLQSLVLEPVCLRPVFGLEAKAGRRQSEGKRRASQDGKAFSGGAGAGTAKEKKDGRKQILGHAWRPPFPHTHLLE